MGPIEEARWLNILTCHRELLVFRLRSIQCILDNLLACGFLCEEDVEIVQRTTTKTNQVRKILELVQCKGEESCEYFIYIIYKVCDAYIDLQPWLKEINYSPSRDVMGMNVVNTDPISRYCEKLRHEMSRDTCFIMSYGQREETRLEELYTDTLMELLNDCNESLGFLESLDELLGDHGAFNPQGETIYVVGDAGVGKSILLQKLQNLWSKKELQTEAIFFFKFRCRMFSIFKDREEISLRDLLFKYNCYPDHDPDNEVFDYIQRFPERVIFTFDGYDEIQEELNILNVPEVMSPDDKAQPLQLLISLLSGKLLKGSKKVLTARTGIEIQSRVIRKKLALRGFLPSHLKTYINLHFKEQEQRDLISAQLDASPHLSSLCSTPLFCWIVFKSFRHLDTMHDSFHLPETCITITDIFLLLCEVFLSRSVLPAAALLKKRTRCASDTFKKGLRPLAEFAKLALQGMETRHFIYREEEIAECGLTDEDLLLGFLRPVTEYDAIGSPPAFEFLHITLQSFLAAFALVLDEQAGPSSILKFFTECSRKTQSSCLPSGFCIDPKEKEPFETNEHLQYTNLFLCGLTSKAHTGLMDYLMSPVVLKKKRALLKSYLSTSVKSHIHGLPQYDREGIKKVHVLPGFLWILRCICETGSKEIAQVAAKGMSAGHIKLNFCNIFSGDCIALNFVLQHCVKPLGLEMDNNNISDYGVMQLKPCLCNIKEVRLSVNYLSDSSIEVLAEELCKHKVVEILGMWGNTIGDEGAEAFAEALRHHPRLTNLSLSANGITSEGGRFLAEALKENTVLRIFWLVQNELNDDAAPHLAKLVQENTGLSHLWLINNQFTVNGIRHLATALTHNTALKEISLKGNQLSEEEEKQFVADRRLRFH
ncbi:nucleotide-binding oligomerization domain-containing protein 1 isoform X2 [Antennarius striatus]|uniref:nucleotide-binding oligomerization domain-containing protein 1 isoform X2 n=1 Tax=Antennarius striatus TaxID=241820 RepID=UPI0035B33FFA